MRGDDDDGDNNYDEDDNYSNDDDDEEEEEMTMLMEVEVSRLVTLIFKMKGKEYYRRQFFILSMTGYPSFHSNKYSRHLVSSKAPQTFTCQSGILGQPE